MTMRLVRRMDPAEDLIPFAQGATRELDKIR
jgi:hypothetical protein